MKIVRLNRTDDEGPVWVNLSQVLLIFPEPEGNGSRIVLGSSETVYVTENPAEVYAHAE